MKERRFKAVIILSALMKKDLKGEIIFPTIDENSQEKVWGGRMRLIAGADLFMRGSTPLLILVGGSTLIDGEYVPKTERMAKFLREKFNIPEKNIVLCPTDRPYTLRKAEFMREKLKELKLNPKEVALITSAFHLPRTKLMFRNQGLGDLIFIPAERILIKKSKHYLYLIKKPYNSSQMKIRWEFEKRGIKAFKEGKYRPRKREEETA